MGGPGRPPDCEDEALEVAGRSGHEEACAFVAGEERVRSALPNEKRVTAVEIVNLGAGMEAGRALEDVERLVLGVVDVQRWCARRRDGDLEDREPVSRLGRG